MPPIRFASASGTPASVKRRLRSATRLRSRAGKKIEKRSGEAVGAGRKFYDPRAQREPPSIEQPSGAAFHQIGHFEQHLDLHLSRHLVVESFDLGPQIDELEYFAHDQIGSGDLRRRPAGARPHVGDEGDARPVHQIVGDPSGYDFSAQRVGGDLRIEPVAQGGREIAAELLGEFGHLRQS